MSELGDLEDLALLFGMLYFHLLVLLVFVVVCGRAVLVRDAHVHKTSVFAGSRSILAYPPSPAQAIAGL